MGVAAAVPRGHPNGVTARWQGAPTVSGVSELANAPEPGEVATTPASPAEGDDASTADAQASAAPVVAQAPSRHAVRRVRSTIAVVLAILTCVTLVVGGLGVWVRRNVWRTDGYVALVGPLAKDPQVTNAIGLYVTDQLMTVINHAKDGKVIN